MNVLRSLLTFFIILFFESCSAYNKLPFIPSYDEKNTDLKHIDVNTSAPALSTLEVDAPKVRLKKLKDEAMDVRRDFPHVAHLIDAEVDKLLRKERNPGHVFKKEDVENFLNTCTAFFDDYKSFVDYQEKIATTERENVINTVKSGNMVAAEVAADRVWNTFALYHKFMSPILGRKNTIDRLLTQGGDKADLSDPKSDLTCLYNKWRTLWKLREENIQQIGKNIESIHEDADRIAGIKKVRTHIF